MAETRNVKMNVHLSVNFTPRGFPFFSFLSCLASLCSDLNRFYFRQSPDDFLCLSVFTTIYRKWFFNWLYVTDIFFHSVFTNPHMFLTFFQLSLKLTEIPKCSFLSLFTWLFVQKSLYVYRNPCTFLFSPLSFLFLFSFRLSLRFPCNLFLSFSVKSDPRAFLFCPFLLSRNLQLFWIFVSFCLQ